jgi:DUF218 domain
MRARDPLWAVALLALAAGCSRRAPLPKGPAEPAALGRCGADIDETMLCRDWSEAVAACRGDATVHDSFPELSEASCFVPVHHHEGVARAQAIPEGCGYQASQRVLRQLELQAERFDRAAHGTTQDPPMALDCELPNEVRHVTAAHNAAVTRHLAERLVGHQPFAYAAVSTFGFGASEMSDSPLVGWVPDDDCIALDKREMDRLSVNVRRAGVAASAYHGGVAPIVTVSGGAVHAELVEAFALMHLLSCRFGVPADAIMLDPCADHTHTNLRNTGGLIRGVGGRRGYVVTDEGLQGGYLQEWSAFWLVGGTIDQRARRDFGYLLGAWRQASVGYDAGFWFTPYRFWGEAEDKLGGASCVR